MCWGLFFNKVTGPGPHKEPIEKAVKEDGE